MFKNTNTKLKNYLNYKKDHLKTHCIKVDDVYLDKSISNFIIYLNKIGLKTYASCSGFRYEHEKEMNLAERGYIGFIYDSKSKPLLNKIEEICLEEGFDISKRYNPVLDIICMDIYTRRIYHLKPEDVELIDDNIKMQWHNLEKRIKNEISINKKSKLL